MVKNINFMVNFIDHLIKHGKQEIDHEQEIIH